VTIGGVAALILGALPAAFPPPPVFAVSREVAGALRDTFEGRTLRLRIDLHSAAHSVEPNVMTVSGMGYGREGSPVLFHRMEMVFVDRVTSEGGSRVSLTIYRSETEARDLRANAIPGPMPGGPTAALSTTAFARTDSTAVILELGSGRKDPAAQRREVMALLDRLFYIDTEPARDEVEAFVLQHRDWPVARLAALTGLTQDEVRALVTGTPRAPE
jgi:hypothetical protein